MNSSTLLERGDGEGNHCYFVYIFFPLQLWSVYIDTHIFDGFLPTLKMKE